MHLGHLELNPAVVAEVIPAFTEIKIPMQLPKNPVVAENYSQKRNDAPSTSMI